MHELLQRQYGKIHQNVKCEYPVTAIPFHGLCTPDVLPQIGKDIYIYKKMFLTVVYWHGKRGNNLNSNNKEFYRLAKKT